jgi:thiol-disulfide isomerase/thioredoxin
MKRVFISLSLASGLLSFANLNVLAQKKTTSPPKTVKKTAVKTAQTTQKPQTNPNWPKVTQIDETTLTNLLKANGKLLLVNFWATWCDPCREEFPELIKISQDFKDKLDFITVSWDDLAEINRDVPKFLAQVKADNISNYLLKTDNEDAAIRSVSKDWVGGLPFTIMYNEKSEVIFTRMGKIKPDVLRAEIEKHIAQTTAKTP